MNFCTYRWDGLEWVEIAGGCPEGQSCPIPRQDGDFVGQTRYVFCS